MSIPNQKLSIKTFNIPYYYNSCTNVSSYENTQHVSCCENYLPSGWKIVKYQKKNLYMERVNIYTIL